MHKKSQTDKHNIVQLFERGNPNYVTRAEFIEQFAKLTCLHSVKGIRSRLCSSIGKNEAHVILKADLMLNSRLSLPMRKDTIETEDEHEKIKKYVRFSRKLNQYHNYEL